MHCFRTGLNRGCEGPMSLQEISVVKLASKVCYIMQTGLRNRLRIFVLNQFLQQIFTKFSLSLKRVLIANMWYVASDL